MSIVVATQLPFLDRGFFFAKAHPQKSFAVSAEVEEARAPRGMYISIDEPTRSIRSAPSDDGTRQLIVGGESRRPGDEQNDEDAYHALEEFMRAEFNDCQRPSCTGPRTTTSPLTGCPTSDACDGGTSACMLRPASPSGG